VLTRRSTPEVRIDDQHPGVAARRIVERMHLTARGHRASFIFEEMTLDSLERDGSQEPRGKDPIGVDVVPSNDDGCAADACDGGVSHCRDSSNS